MKPDEIRLHHIRMPLKKPFANRLTTVTERDLILVELVTADGVTGWGECVAFASPWYTEETVKTAWHVMEDYLIPLLGGEPLSHPDEASQRFSVIRGNPMAKAALEGAVWDANAKERGLSLAQALGGHRERIQAGVAVGASSIEGMLREVEERIVEGYRRVKVKIGPGADLHVIAAIRDRFPLLALMADANSAYTLEDSYHLKQLDAFQLMMLEQPLAADDFMDHARLQRELSTPLCLDESLHGLADVRLAWELESCRVVSVKPGRVGGLSEAVRIHDFCGKEGIPLWVGGMLESGIARAHNIALASLPHFTLPGDLSASARYWHQDLIEPAITVDEGLITVPKGPGIGVEVDRERIRHFCVRYSTQKL